MNYKKHSFLENLVGFLLQRLEDKEKNNKRGKTKIRFPKGVLRKAKDIRKELDFISTGTLRRNIAYHLILADFYNWLLNRFYIGLTLKEMLIKETIALYGNIMAAVVFNVANQIEPTDERRGIKKACSILINHNIIEKDLKDDILWVWGIRNKVHIEGLKEWEYNKYEMIDLERTLFVWNELKISLILNFLRNP